MKRIFLICAAALMMCSCLKENLKSTTTAGNYYRSVTEIKTGLNGCYNPMRNIFSARGYWEMTELAADLLTLASQGYYDANCNVSPARPGIGKTVWQYGYMGVQRSNDMIAAIDAAVAGKFIKDTDAPALYAEAVVLRSMYYYLLTCTFGNVPYYNVPVREENRQKIATLPRMSADSTRSHCIAELREWLIVKQALPMVRTYDENTQYRMGAAAGLMIGAKMCMWNKDWKGAIEFVDNLEMIYGNYAYSPEQFGKDYLLTDIPFSRKYVPESIWELSNVVESYGLQSSAVLASITTPGRTSVPKDWNAAPMVEPEDGEEEEEEADEGSDLYAGIAIPELGGYARTSSSTRPTAYYYKQLLPYTSKDLRGHEYDNGDDPSKPRVSSGNMAWCWTGYDLKTDKDRKDRKVMYFWTSKSSQTRMSSTSQPWLGNKFWAYGMYNSKDPNNYKIFRFADALLMKAEAYLEDGQTDKAADYLNITRTRAGYADKITFEAVGSDKESFLEEIRKERAKELVGEFQRKFDLVRWGIWYKRTSMYNENKYQKDYIQEYHRYWPIPADQVSYSGGALDNNEYMN